MSISAALALAKKYSNGGAVDMNPSPAQREAGNYKKRHIEFQGIPITIENPKGTIRKGTNSNGKTWANRMAADYGYIKRTEGKDGDQVDAFIGPNKRSNKVFVIDQLHHSIVRFDEHKCLLGFNTEKQALTAYHSSYGRKYGAHHTVGAVTEMSIDAFKEWLKGGGGKKPISPEVPKYKRGGAAKATKATAHYRLGTQAEHCGICTMFRAPDSCTSVLGKIRWMDNCDYFEKVKKYQNGGVVFDPEFLGKYLPEKTPNVRVREGHQEFEPGYIHGWDVGDPTVIMNMRGQQLLARKAQEGGAQEPFEAGYPEPEVSDEDLARAQIVRETAPREGGLMQTVPQFAQMVQTPEGRSKLWEATKTAASEFIPGMVEQAKVPGEAMAGKITPEQEAEWGAGTALGMVGGASPFAKPGTVGIAGGRPPGKPGPEAVHYWKQAIVDQLIERHGERPEQISEALNKIRETASPEAENVVLQGLPEQMRIDVMRHRMQQGDQPRQGEPGAQGARQVYLHQVLNEFTPEEIQKLDPKQLHFLAEEANRFEDRLEGLGIDPDKKYKNWDVLQDRFAWPDMEEGYAKRQMMIEDFRDEIKRKAELESRFREITHPEEARDWLRDHGHNPEDWGYSDPENYVELANKMKRQEMGLAPSPAPERTPVRTAPQQGADPLAALADYLEADKEARGVRVTHVSDEDLLDKFFGQVSPSKVEHMSSDELLNVRSALSRVADPHSYGENYPELWGALHDKLDRIDRRLDEQMTWEDLERLTSPEPTAPARQTPAPIPVGPFQPTSSAQRATQFTNHFNSTILPYFKNQEEFAHTYFGGMDTNHINASVGYDPMGSMSPAFYFDGPLYHPETGEAVASVQRYIVPELKYAYHGLASFNRKYQSGEVAPNMLRGQIDTYQRMGLDYVKLRAGLESGPYAWAKYGWIPQQDSWNFIRRNLQSYLDDGRLKVSDPEVREALNAILQQRDPRFIWNLADITATDDFGNEIGRTALLGRQTRNARNITFPTQGWDGQLNLKNAESMERFDAYYKRQIEKARKKPKLVTD